MANSMVTLHYTRQNGESTAQCYKRFISQVEVTESEFGKLIPTKCKGKPSEQQEKARKACLARLFILGLDKAHKQSVSNLGTAYTNKQNNYPETPEAALRRATEQLEARRGTTADPTQSEPGNSQEGVPMSRNSTSFHQTPVPAPTVATSPVPPPESSQDGTGTTGTTGTNVRFSGSQR